jgi:NitT/TauT family transport system permease protein
MSIISPQGQVSKITRYLVSAGWLLVLLLGGSLIDIPFLPKPLEVLNALKELLGKGLLYDLFVSFKLNVQAIAVTTILSLLLVYSSVLPLMRPVVVFFTKIRFLGLVGLTLFFTMATHGDAQFKLSLLVYGMSVWFVTSMLGHLDSIPKEQFDHARTLGMSKWRIVWEVVVRGKADTALDVMRENAAIGWMMLTMVEGIARSEGGIGPLILNYNRFMRIDSVFAILAVVLIVALLQDAILGVIKGLLFPYATMDTEKK